MPAPLSFDTTAPGAADTYTTDNQVPGLWLILLWSASQPHRVGESAFFPAFERRYVGRGDVEVAKFAHFAPHRPGEPLTEATPEGFLKGDSISRRQLYIRATAIDLEMEQVGKCVTLVNGVECRRAGLQPGDTVVLKGELLLLCVRRVRELPVPRGMGKLHPFGRPDAAGIVGESQAVWQLRADLLAAAAGDEHVLIQGETGSGKELAARAIHQMSRRAKGPYVEHNAANATLSLIQSELFGNIANYPNPGMPARKGVFPSADHGTLFLDEIGDCPEEAQVQLLRALEVGACTPVGESIARRVDVRVVGATHRNDNPLRLDFGARFLRHVRVPPVRERPEDIPLLVDHLMRLHAQRLQEPERVEFEKRFFRLGPTGETHAKISWRLIDHLVRQPLPLNVREVKAALLQALEASTGTEVRMPLSNTTAPPPPPPRADAVKEGHDRGGAAPGTPSKAELLAWLEQEEWNVSRVGRRLGLHRHAVYRLMEGYGIKREDTET